MEHYCCPKTIKKTSVSHIVVLSDTFPYYHEHTRCSLLVSQSSVHCSAAVNTTAGNSPVSNAFLKQQFPAA